MNKHLLPREHGAYAELGFPLLTGLVLGTPTWPAWLFVAAALLFFFANEPLVILAGARGKRLQAELAAPAKARLLLLGSLGAACGLAALWLAPASARWLALVPAALAAGLAPVVLAKNLKTLPGEFIAAAAFSSMVLPVAASGGVSGIALWGPALMWFVTTLVATLSVHAIKSRVTGAAPWVVPAATWSARLALLLALAAVAWLPAWRTVALAACLPLAGVIAVNHLALSPKKLKQVGWALVVANSLALTVLATH